MGQVNIMRVITLTGIAPDMGQVNVIWVITLTGIAPDMGQVNIIKVNRTSYIYDNDN